MFKLILAIAEKLFFYLWCVTFETEYHSGLLKFLIPMPPFTCWLEKQRPRIATDDPYSLRLILPVLYVPNWQILSKQINFLLIAENYHRPFFEK